MRTSAYVIRYFSMGAASTAVNLGTFVLFHEILHVWYMAAAVIAFLARMALKFFLIRTWLFRARLGESLGRHLASFLLLEAGYLSGGLLCLSALVEFAGLPPFLALCVVSFAFSLGALMMTRLVFAPKKAPGPV